MVDSEKAVTTRSNSRAVMMPTPTAEATVSKFTKGGKVAVTIDALTNIIREQNTSFEKLINGLSDKIDGWRNDIMTCVAATESRISAIEDKIEVHTKQFEAKIDAAIKDLQHRSRLSNNLHIGALLKTNDREQRNRCNSVKVSYYLDMSTNAAPTAREVFNKIIITYCLRTRPRNSSEPTRRLDC